MDCLSENLPQAPIKRKEPKAMPSALDQPPLAFLDARQFTYASGSGTASGTLYDFRSWIRSFRFSSGVIDAMVCPALLRGPGQ